MDSGPFSTYPAAAAGEVCHWNKLSVDLIELILSLLPVRSIVRAGAVCKFWQFLITHPSFAARVAAAARAPWFFLYGQNNVHLRRNQAFAFDPASGEWIHLPPIYLSAVSNDEDEQRQPDEYFVGSGGFIFATSGSTRTSFCYAPLLRGAGATPNTWRETPPLCFSRRNPVVGVLRCRGEFKFIVAGGVRFVGGLVDIEEQLAVEIFDSAGGGWQLCPPLPAEFRSGNSSQGLSSALLGGNSFFVFGIYSGLLARFDMSLRVWSGVQTLRPPGVIFSFLVACRDRLVLAGLRISAGGAPSFELWRVEADGGGCSEMGAMPEKMLLGIFDGDEEERFASLRCVGADGLLYVFNEAHHRAYPACVCEISGGGAGRCAWREVPPLPAQVNRFHKVITFCSAVPLDSVLNSGAGKPPAAVAVAAADGYSSRPVL
ncbi:unnamed protein product [Spirodela intermedia]|uniref:F-box domain-containing protein n=1 Tax=Spirodela intermedia TaxID=51605 RepID=A0A7I8IEV9_SPIIN|nr:unnamed protein product [Spirodela intermedia]CAA6655392.1 unnamed protein product [Spirodela intermedia]